MPTCETSTAGDVGFESAISDVSDEDVVALAYALVRLAG